MLVSFVIEILRAIANHTPEISDDVVRDEARRMDMARIAEEAEIARFTQISQETEENYKREIDKICNIAQLDSYDPKLSECNGNFIISYQQNIDKLNLILNTTRQLYTLSKIILGTRTQPRSSFWVSPNKAHTSNPDQQSHPAFPSTPDRLSNPETRTQQRESATPIKIITRADLIKISFLLDGLRMILENNTSIVSQALPPIPEPPSLFQPLSVSQSSFIFPPSLTSKSCIPPPSFRSQSLFASSLPPTQQALPPEYVFKDGGPVSATCPGCGGKDNVAIKKIMPMPGEISGGRIFTEWCSLKKKMY